MERSVKKVVVRLFLLLFVLVWGADSIGFINLGLPFCYYARINEIEKHRKGLEDAGVKDLTIQGIKPNFRISFVEIHGIWKDRLQFFTEVDNEQDRLSIFDRASSVVVRWDDIDEISHYRFSKNGEIEKALGKNFQNGLDVIRNLWEFRSALWELKLKGLDTEKGNLATSGNIFYIELPPPKNRVK